MGDILDNNLMYILITILLAYVGIKITKKIIKLIIGIIFFAFTILKFIVRTNLI